MKFSIITINFNNLEGLQKTLKSVEDQSFKDYEHIMIDGGSTDGSKDYIESKKDNFSYWVSEKDHGIYHAMNKGLTHVNGDYIIHMNSGDLFYSEHTLSQVAAELNSNEDIICGNSLFINDPFLPSYLWRAPSEVSFNFFCRDTLNHQSVFIKKALFDRMGLYRENYKSASDWIFFLEAFSSFQATYKSINTIVSVFDRSGFSTVNWKVGFKEQQEFLSKNFSFFCDSTNKDLEFIYPFRINLKKNIKILIRLILPFGVVRYIENYKAKKRRKSLEDRV